MNKERPFKAQMVLKGLGSRGKSLSQAALDQRGQIFNNTAHLLGAFAFHHNSGLVFCARVTQQHAASASQFRNDPDTIDRYLGVKA